MFFLFNQVQAKIIEMGKCYYVDGYQTQNSWNIKDYENSNTFHYKFLDKPVRKNYTNSSFWKVKEIESFIFDEKEIKEYMNLNYKSIFKKKKHVLSINFNNGIVTRLIVSTDELINLYNKEIQIRNGLKKKLPDKWKIGYYNDSGHVESLYERIRNQTIIEKYKIDTYVDGLIIARNLDANGDSIKINLNTMKFVWGFFATIINEEYNHYCNKDYKNISTKENTTKQKSNSGLKELLKKIY